MPVHIHIYLYKNIFLKDYILSKTIFNLFWKITFILWDFAGFDYIGIWEIS